MAGTPETLYAKDGDSHHLAYQVVGDGLDLLFVPTATFPIDLLWDEPTVAGHLRRLASFSRLILTDLLGTGSSDAVPIHDRPAMQAWTDGLVIQAPTLLLHRRGDRHVRGEHTRDLSEGIPHARLVELEGDDNIWFAGDTDRVLDEIESFLTGGRPATPSNRVLSTVLFTDIVGSTQRAVQLGDDAWTAGLAAHNRLIERHVAGARGVIVKFTGDGALAMFDGPTRAINCACAIRDAVEDLGLEIRAGLHTGEVEMADGDVHGIAVHIAARIMSLAGAGEVLVSGVIPPLVLGSRIAFADRGSHQLKGVPDGWPVLAVRDSGA
jgi:class 3 adenylate cyclase